MDLHGILNSNFRTRTHEYELCIKCGAVVYNRIDHYVSAVAPDGFVSGTSYWMCVDYPDKVEFEQVSV